jgi:uncharacterized surface protein with fasciclin (FAS1) repeats
MKTNKLFLLLLTGLITSSLSATVHTINAGFPYYSPSTLVINLGDTVEWINDGGSHDVNANISTISGNSFNNPVSFDSPVTSIVGATIYTHIFNTIGIYNYDCSVGSHAAAGMVGSVTVVGTVYDIVSNSNDHTTLKAAIDACELDDVLSGSDPYTLFAPTNAAFDELPEGVLEALLLDTDELTNILLHHVVSGGVMSTDLSPGQVVATLFGNVTVTVDGDGNIFIGDAQVTVANVEADNGVVHIIDKVLKPYLDCNDVVDGIAALDDCGTCYESYMYVGMGDLTYVATYADTVGVAGTFILAGSPMDIGNNPNWNDCPNTIYDIVSNSEEHTKLKYAIDACELDDVLSGTDPYTLFAPTDAAFGLLPDGTLTALLSEIDQLTNILLHHVVSGGVISTDLSPGQVVTTLFGNVTVTVDGDGNIFIDNAQVTVANIEADNGVVHVIDKVLLPYFDCNDVLDGIAALDDCGVCHESYMYAGMGDLTYVATYADTVGVAGTFVLSGSTMDVMSNPNWNDCPNTIYDIVSNSNDHTTLKAAIDACELNGALSAEGPLTLFAPTNAAFDLLPEGTVEALLLDIDQLTNILLHHVVSGGVMSTDLSPGQVVTTLSASDVTVTINASGVFIDDAQVTLANLVAQNGVVHVIDAVLIPTTTSVTDIYNEVGNKYLYSVNLLGERISKGLNNQIVFDVFQNGDVIKRFVR